MFIGFLFQVNNHNGVMHVDSYPTAAFLLSYISPHTFSVSMVHITSCVAAGGCTLVHLLEFPVDLYDRIHPGLFYY